MSSFSLFVLSSPSTNDNQLLKLHYLHFWPKKFNSLRRFPEEELNKNLFHACILIFSPSCIMGCFFCCSVFDIFVNSMIVFLFLKCFVFEFISTKQGTCNKLVFCYVLSSHFMKAFKMVTPHWRLQFWYWCCGGLCPKIAYPLKNYLQC